MSDEKRWRFEDRGEFPDYIWQEDEDGSEGLHIASFYISDAAESIVADHNARLVQAPAGAPGDVRAAAERLLAWQTTGSTNLKADIETVARHVLAGSRGAEGLAAENERLREALEKMLAIEDSRCCNLYDEGHTEDCPTVFARAALAARSEGEGT